MLPTLTYTLAIEWDRKLSQMVSNCNPWRLLCQSVKIKVEMQKLKEIKVENLLLQLQLHRPLSIVLIIELRMMSLD